MEPETSAEKAEAIHVRKFDVKPFYLAKYQVTYAQYQAFVDAVDGFDNLIWWRGMPEAYQRQPLHEQRTTLPNNPRDSLSWYQSVAFARWVNHRQQGFALLHPSGEGMFRTSLPSFLPFFLPFGRVSDATLLC